jgi:hypothetical protein
MVGLDAAVATRRRLPAKAERPDAMMMLPRAEWEGMMS